MKKTIVALFAIIISVICYAQPDNKIVLGTIDTLHSGILNEKRKLLIHVPKGSSIPGSSKQTYPVVYLLDGDAHFNSVVSMIQHLSRVSACPEMIVVGISNTNRTRDLTPTKSGNDPFLSKISNLSVQTSGGGEAFISFIEKELMPYINSTYPTQPYKILIGHSFGGLTVMNTLINHTKLFNTYIAIDPSMWWDDLNFLKASKKAMAEKDLTGRTLYLAIANTIDEDMETKQILKDTTLDIRGIRAVMGMDDFIKTSRPKGLKYDGKYYKNDSHNSVTLIAAYDALRYVFADYEFRVRNKDVLDSTVALAEKFKVRYQKVSKLFGYEVKPPESEINTYAYIFLRRKQFKKAEDFFKLNVSNYPSSFNVYDSYGDFFVDYGNKVKAIENFEKALSIKENEETRKKLNKLKGE